MSGGLEMDVNYARGKKERWGNRPCRHAVKIRETDNDIPTGNYVCIICGLSMSVEGWRKLIQISLK
jgi:hypothetical protein